MGAGWNLGNQLEANSGGTPNETAWSNPVVTQELISAVADAGFKSVRVPVSYLSMIDDANGYAVDSAWLDRVEEVVQYCYAEGLYVIINVHGDGYNSIDGGWLLCNDLENQEYICEKYDALWKQIAERFKDYDEHLIFEAMNEEFDGETYAGDINREYYANINNYNQIFIDAVRSTGAKNTHRYLMITGWNTNIDYTVGDYGFEMPTDPDCTAGENRLMMSVHYYDPWDYCGEENIKTFLWGARGQAAIEAGVASSGMGNWGQEDFLDGQMQKLYDSYISQNIPVVIGEYGCIDKTTADANNPGEIQANRVYYNGYLAGKAASMGIIPVYWDNGHNSTYGFGLFDRRTYEQTQPEIISAIIEAVANKILRLAQTQLLKLLLKSPQKFTLTSVSRQRFTHSETHTTTVHTAQLLSTSTHSSSGAKRTRSSTQVRHLLMQLLHQTVHTAYLYPVMISLRTVQS
jgi:endoglucanase